MLLTKTFDFNESTLIYNFLGFLFVVNIEVCLLED